MLFTDKILVTGANGVLGSALILELQKLGYKNIMTPSKQEMDCSSSESVSSWFQSNKPDYVFHLASLVFGLKGNLDNQFAALDENIKIARNVLLACSQFGIKKVFYAGTVAGYAYPYKNMPLKEEDFWNGEPHNGEYGYAIAKRYALSLLKILNQTKKLDYTYGLFTNLYGPRDKFDIVNGHVIPSLIRKAMIAADTNSSLEVWGYPETIRDFLYSHDAALAAIYCMNTDIDVVNISSCTESSMKDVTETIISAIDKDIKVVWNNNAPVGIPYRLVDNSKLKDIGFDKFTSLQEGVKRTVEWYCLNKGNVRK